MGINFEEIDSTLLGLDALPIGTGVSLTPKPTKPAVPQPAAAPKPTASSSRKKATTTQPTSSKPAQPAPKQITGGKGAGTSGNYTAILAKPIEKGLAPVGGGVGADKGIPSGATTEAKIGGAGKILPGGKATDSRLGTSGSKSLADKLRDIKAAAAKRASDAKASGATDAQAAQAAAQAAADAAIAAGTTPAAAAAVASDAAQAAGATPTQADQAAATAAQTAAATVTPTDTSTPAAVTPAATAAAQPSSSGGGGGGGGPTPTYSGDSAASTGEEATAAPESAPAAPAPVDVTPAPSAEPVPVTTSTGTSKWLVPGIIGGAVAAWWLFFRKPKKGGMSGLGATTHGKFKHIKDLLEIKKVAKRAATWRLAGKINLAINAERVVDMLVGKAEREGWGSAAFRAEVEGQQAASMAAWNRKYR